MVTVHRIKSADKPEVCKKVLTLLKKVYGASSPKPELPVLETLLYAICLENSSPEQAEHGYASLHNIFFDLNEVRVSSIYELEGVFRGAPDPDWKALRIRNVLQYVFETTYSFDLESIKRKTIELALKQLTKIKSLTPFIRSYTLQNALGSHILPVDEVQNQALIWIGLSDAGSSSEQTAEALKGHVRKADAPQFGHWIRCLATDPKYAEFLKVAAHEPERDVVWPFGIERLEALLKHGAPALRPKAIVEKAPVNDAHPSAKKSNGKAPPAAAGGEGGKRHEPMKSEHTSAEHAKTEAAAKSDMRSKAEQGKPALAKGEAVKLARADAPKVESKATAGHRLSEGHKSRDVVPDKRAQVAAESRKTERHEKGDKARGHDGAKAGAAESSHSETPRRTVDGHKVSEAKGGDTHHKAEARKGGEHSRVTEVAKAGGAHKAGAKSKDKGAESSKAGDGGSAKVAADSSKSGTTSKGKEVRKESLAGKAAEHHKTHETGKGSKSGSAGKVPHVAKAGKAGHDAGDRHKVAEVKGKTKGKHDDKSSHKKHR